MADAPANTDNSDEAQAASPNTSTQGAQNDKKPKRPARVLTQQQLAKKRQNDREAQRAIRERTKQTIEALETKIRELESGEAYAHLQEVVDDRNALKAENDNLRQRLNSILDIVQPAVGR